MMPVIDTKLCKCCGICADACPVDAVMIKNGKAYITIECMQDNHCVSLCPESAIKLPDEF